MTIKEIAGAFRELSNEDHAVEIIEALNKAGKLEDVAEELIEFSFDFDPLNFYNYEEGE